MFRDSEVVNFLTFSRISPPLPSGSAMLVVYRDQAYAIISQIHRCNAPPGFCYSRFVFQMERLILRASGRGNT